MTCTTPGARLHRGRRSLLALSVAAATLALGALPGAAQTESPGQTDDTTPADGSATTAPAPTTTATPGTSAAPATTAAPGTSAAPPSTTAGPSAEDQALIDAAEANKAAEVDAANAEVGEVRDALEVLQAKVADQSAQVDYATGRLAEAERAVADAEAEVTATEGQLAELEQQVGELAVRAFVGDGADEALLLTTGDPTEALRMDTLRAEATQTDLDLLDQLGAARDDLEDQRAEAAAAVEEATALRAESEEALGTLQQDKAAQAQVASSAEDRLDLLLSERAALEQIGADIEAGKPVDDLADLLASNPTAPAGSAGDVPVPDLVTDAEIVDVGQGIQVHQSIADQVRQLLADAQAAGVDLGGGGYRSPASQIATRRANCGTSTYAIYEMPASQCSPPTARPGRSMHEKGLAIDFTVNGSLIRSRSGSGWNWLASNAARYGLSNLPSEPWHWSTNGK